MADDSSTTVFAQDDRYRLLIEAVTDYAIYMLDAAGHVSSWNPGAERIKGYKPAEILGQHFSRFYTADDRAAGIPRRALDTAAREGRFEAEGWRVRKDGTRFWAHVLIDPVRTSSGEVVGYAKVTRDLTERRNAEQQLRASQEQFKRLIHGVTDYAIIMLNPEGCVTNWNVGAQRIKGYRADEIVGAHFSKFYTDEDRERGEPDRGLSTAAREGRFENEAIRVRKDGSRFWAHVVIDRILDEDGGLVGFTKITRDVTERRQAQQALEQAREALFQSQKMEAVGQLTGGVAHDFNNLLMAVLSSLELLKKRLPMNDPLHVLADSAMAAAQRGSSLTRRMLTFARRQTLHPEPVDVPSLVHGMAELLQRSTGPLVRIETDFPKTPPFVFADVNQLEAALLNLVLNARDAMPQGGPIRIAATYEPAPAATRHGLPPDDYVRVAVTDTGVGMDEATLARATEPFFTTKAIGKGTGLGLSTVHGMAEQSNGKLVLRSRPDRGTTAELWLPSTTRPTVSLGSPASTNATVATSSLDVLLVDDDPLVLENTKTMLEDLGHVVTAARSGTEAMHILERKGDFALVVTDHAMPYMTGAELALTIRDQHPVLKIILMTGYADLPPTAQHLPRLMKPFRQADLAGLIENVLRVPSHVPHVEYGPR